MPDSHIIPLRQAADEVTASQTPEEKFASLSKAFELFNLETIRLEKAYSELKEQFRAMNLELEDTNTRLQDKVLELEVVNNYLNTILRNITQGILFIDLVGTVTTYNAAAEAILGVDSREVLFESFWKNFADDIFGFSMREALTERKDHDLIYKQFEGSSTVKAEVEIDTTFVLKGGWESRGDETFHPLDTMQGLIVILRDITEMRHLQTLANRHDRMQGLGEMAAMVAHEIRNPLGGIKGFASLLVRDLQNMPEQQQMAQYIVEGTDTLNRLVTNVLSYARPVQTKLESADLIALVNTIKEHIKADDNIPKNIDIRINTQESALFIPVDVQLFRAAILNLVVNSIQAMPQGGSITIGINRADAWAVITVLDTGEGIPSELLDKIFQPFFTTKSTGSGFGLNEVHKIITAHGGQVEVKSEKGKGTCFTIRVPTKPG